MQSFSSSKRSKLQPQVDAHVEDHGTIYLVRPVSNFACDWITENVGADSQYFGNALVVEHRFVADLVRAMAESGLVLR